MNELDLLKDLTLLPGVSGNEKAIRNYMKTQLKPIANAIHQDNLGSIAFQFNGTGPKILLVGHMDEIGFMVHSIRKDGLINFIALGGFDPRTLMSSPVEITNRKGEKAIGLIGSVPVHHLKDTSGKLSIDDMYIDIGAQSDEDVEATFGIAKGDFITLIPHYHYIQKKGCIISKAFDDRVGVAVAIEAGKHFSKAKHPNTLFCAGSVQEEVGIRGAQTIAQLVKPDIAIVIEGAPGDDFPKNSDELQAKMNGGVQIRMIDPTMITNPALAGLAIDIAKKHKIAHQVAVRKSGGTDAGKLHLAGIGCPVIVLSAPVRYAHSHNGILSLADYTATRELAFALIKAIDSKMLKKILDE